MIFDYVWIVFLKFNMIGNNVFFWMRVVIGGSLVWFNFCFVVVCDMYCLSDVRIVLDDVVMLGLCDI